MAFPARSAETPAQRAGFRRRGPSAGPVADRRRSNRRRPRGPGRCWRRDGGARGRAGGAGGGRGRVGGGGGGGGGDVFGVSPPPLPIAGQRQALGAAGGVDRGG